MLGWFIVISIAGGDEPMKVGDVRTLATWRSSIGGVDWIDRLVERRLAKFRVGQRLPDSIQHDRGSGAPAHRQWQAPSAQ